MGKNSCILLHLLRKRVEPLKPFKKHIAALLLLLCGVVITPQSVIHCFSGHTDTKHVEQTYAGRLSFEESHHHCDSLQLSIPPYAETATHVSITLSFTAHVYKTLLPQAASLAFQWLHALRGPPMAEYQLV